jgi:Cna protein B-type domain.
MKNGIAEFNRLPLGYYEIRETAAPENYTVEAGQESIYIRVSEDGITSLVLDEGRQPPRWSTRANSSRVTVNSREKSITVGNKMAYGALKITKSRNHQRYRANGNKRFPDRRHLHFQHYRHRRNHHGRRKPYCKHHL